MQFVITDINRFKSTAKQCINLANNKLATSLEQCVELSLSNGDILTFTTISSNSGVKLNMPIEGSTNVDGNCLIHYSKFALLISKIPAKAQHLKISLANNILSFSLLGMGSIGESIWIDSNTLHSSTFLDESKYVVLVEDNTTIVPHLLSISEIAKACDTSVIGIKGDSKELLISGKFGTTGNNLFLSKLDSIGNITFAVKPTTISSTLAFLGNSITIGYNSNNKWLMFYSEKGVVCYKSLSSITNIERTIKLINALDGGGCLTLKRNDLDLAINFHAEGDYINLTSDTTNTLLQVFSVNSREPAKLKPQLYDGGFIDTKVEINHLKQALNLTNNNCSGVTINQRITTSLDTDITILVINSPDNGAIETTTIVYACI